EGRSFAWLDRRHSDQRRWLVAGNLDRLQTLELLALGAGTSCGAGSGLILGDELFQMPSLGEHCGVGTLLVLAQLLLVLKEGVDLAGKHGQLAMRQVERVVARIGQKRAIVRHDQARFAE